MPPRKREYSKYQAYEFDADDVFADPFDEEVCIRLNRSQARVLAELVTYQAWRTRWYGNVPDQPTVDLWVADVIARLFHEDDCSPETCDEPTCFEIEATHPAITYYPNHPIKSPGYAPPPYEYPAWTDGAGYILAGAGDAMINPLSIENLSSVLEIGAPSWTLHFQGAGEIDVTFISQPQGGMVWLFPDGNYLLGQKVDLNYISLQDLIGIGPIFDLLGEITGEDQTSDSVFTWVFDTGGSHTLTAWYVPAIDFNDVPYLFFGGGLRKIQLCGPTVEVETPMDDDTLKVLIDIQIGLKDVKNEQRGLNYVEGDTTTINIYAPQGRFDGDDAQDIQVAIDRETALCLAVRRFVNSLMVSAYQLLLGSTAGGTALTALAFLLGGPLGFIVGGLTLAAAGTAALIYAAATDTEAMDAVVCDIFQALKGRAISEADFAEALAGVPVGTGNHQVIMNVIQVNAGLIQNYQFIVDCLGYGYQAAQAGAENDCCMNEDTCEGYIDFREPLPGGVYVLSGTWVEGEGILPLYSDGSNWYAIVEIRFPEPCTPAYPLHFRVNANSPSSPGYGDRFTTRRNDDGSLCSGGYQNNYDGWGSETSHTPPCASAGTGEIAGVYITHRLASAQESPQSFPLRGLWWGADLPIEDVPF